MSIGVPAEGLRARAALHPPAAYLLSTGADGRPRVLHLVPGWADGALTFEVSGRTAAALRDRPAVTVLWTPAAAGDHAGMSLIADGDAMVPDTADGTDAVTVTVVPLRGVLHRAAPTTA